jgi:hypothetical protein
LAHRLLEISERITGSQLEREISMDSEDSSDGLSELVDRIHALLSDWLDVVQGEKINLAQFQATMQEFAKQDNKLRRAKAPASILFAAQTRAAREVLPLLNVGETMQEYIWREAWNWIPLCLLL